MQPIKEIIKKTVESNSVLTYCWKKIFFSLILMLILYFFREFLGVFRIKYIVIMY